MRKGQQFVYICAEPGCRKKPIDTFCTAHLASHLASQSASQSAGQSADQAADQAKKLTHGYYLRERSTHASVQSLHNARAAV